MLAQCRELCNNRICFDPLNALHLDLAVDASFVSLVCRAVRTLSAGRAQPRSHQNWRSNLKCVSNRNLQLIWRTLQTVWSCLELCSWWGSSRGITYLCSNCLPSPLMLWHEVTAGSRKLKNLKNVHRKVTQIMFKAWVQTSEWIHCVKVELKF